MVFEHGGDVLERRVPPHQFGGVCRRARQCQSVMFIQSLVDLEYVSSWTVYLVHRLAARDERPQIFVIQLQKSAHKNKRQLLTVG